MSYVYKLTHYNTGKYYFGFRSANKKPANEDLGVHYFSSSNFINKSNFHEYDAVILLDGVSKEEAFDTEQALIYEHRHDDKMINVKCYHGKERFFGSTKPSRYWLGRKMTLEQKQKLALAHQGQTNPHKGIPLVDRLSACAIERVYAGMSKARTLIPIVSCLECKKSVRLNHFTMYHGENCGKGNENIGITTCPYCNKTGSELAMKRWHFENCKEK